MSLVHKLWVGNSRTLITNSITKLSRVCEHCQIRHTSKRSKGKSGSGKSKKSHARVANPTQPAGKHVVAAVKPQDVFHAVDVKPHIDREGGNEGAELTEALDISMCYCPAHRDCISFIYN